MHPITFFFDRYKKLLVVVLCISLVGAGGGWWWYYYQAKQDVLAQNELFQAVYHFESGDYEKALEGDDTYPGFSTLAKTYKYTPTTNLVHLYAGICCMHLNQYKKAIQHLEHFHSKDPILQARTWSLIGDAWSEQKQYKEGIPYYLKAAKHKPNKFFSPTYWHKAALAYEAQQDVKKALECYQCIVKEYAKSSLTTQAEKEIARLEALL